MSDSSARRYTNEEALLGAWHQIIGTSQQIIEGVASQLHTMEATAPLLELEIRKLKLEIRKLKILQAASPTNSGPSTSAEPVSKVVALAPTPPTWLAPGSTHPQYPDEPALRDARVAPAVARKRGRRFLRCVWGWLARHPREK